MTAGTGGSLGQALINALAKEAGGVVGARRSYTAQSWHAQLSKLTSQPRGYEAAEKAGLSATARTLRAWLSDPDYPIRRSDREKIARAYGIMAGRWPGDPRKVDISGQVKIGPDVRTRGEKGRAPLRVDGSDGSWSRIREAWESGEELDPGDVEDWFIEDVLEADLGESSQPYEFPGGGYTVTI